MNIIKNKCINKIEVDTLNYETLQLGSIGDEVIVLQQKLKMLGFYNAIITGSFGLSTEVGVRAFQRAMGLEETRVVNDETWNMLLQYTQSSIATISTFPTLKLGSTGNSVKDLQLKLKALLYYTSSINSNFDTETEIAVKRFQLNNKLTADGIVGTNTWNLINTLYGNLNECAIEDANEQTPNEFTYIVQSGDTLYAIAKKYNTTVDEIKRINNLPSNNLQIGQILKIPLNQ